MKSLTTFLTAVSIAVTLASCALSPARAPAELTRDCPDCPELVAIPTGEFVMGAELAESKRLGLPDYWAVREQPRHRVVVARAFAIGKYEVTRGQFAAFARETGYSPEPGCWHFIGSEWLLDKERSWRDPKIDHGDDYPVTCINWHDASAYLLWLSRKTGQRYRLASEAEYEYVARAGTTTAYWFGDTADEICRYVNLGDLTTLEKFGWDKIELKWEVMDTNHWTGTPCRDGYATMAPVRETIANPFGVHGILGNANEWVADCWNDNYEAAPAIQDARLTGADCGLRVMRGQGWSAVAAGTRPAFRQKMMATDRRFTFGFRVVRDSPAP